MNYEYDESRELNRETGAAAALETAGHGATAEDVLKVYRLHAEGAYSLPAAPDEVMDLVVNCIADLHHLSATPAVLEGHTELMVLMRNFTRDQGYDFDAVLWNADTHVDSDFVMSAHP